MKIEMHQLDWAKIQNSGSGYGPIPEQVDCFTFIEMANEKFNIISKKFENHPIAPALIGDSRIALLNQLGRNVYGITKHANGEAQKTPRTLHAANRIVENFVGNIALACDRLDQDWHDVIGLFFASDGIQVSHLARIHATGSDSHKGGKQVLILTFDAQPHPVRLVYKPADIEVDARILGRTAEIGEKRLPLEDLQLKGFDRTLLVPSFAERIAHWLKIPEAIPVYRFLPRQIGSMMPVGNSLPIQASYGYIEFLSHAPEVDKQGSIKENYDPAHSDWVVTDEKERARFYRESGRLMAISTMLGLIDLHAANMIVHARRPHLIDLEFVCASDAFSLDATGLLDTHSDLRGIGGTLELVLNLDGDDLTPSQAYISLEKSGKADRLDAKASCAQSLYDGFVETMACLDTYHDEILAFIAKELAPCVGRYHVFSTGELHKHLKKAYVDAPGRPMPVWQPHMDEESAFAICDAPTAPDKKAVQWYASGPENFHRDIYNLDMPAFYRRLSEPWLLNSEGKPVAREGMVWQLPKSGMQQTVENLNAIKPVVSRVGSRSRELDKKICLGLDLISDRCKDGADRSVKVGDRVFQTKASGPWEARS